MDWTEPGGALNIMAGEKLLRFDLGTFRLHGVDCPTLTNYEDMDNTCRWCGKPIEQGKRKASYCRGRSHDDYLSCFRLYWRHFEWSSASSWALKRAERKCQNCGCEEQEIKWGFRSTRTNLDVHHIVPLNGESRQFSAFNLPWNLIVLCHDCHMELHEAMRPPRVGKHLSNTWEEAVKVGQGIMFPV